MKRAGQNATIKNKEKGKLFVRDRLHLLLDEDSFIEDAMFAECKDEHLPADGVVTGTGRMNGQTVCVMANDSTVKSRIVGRQNSRKIIRIQETAEKLNCPMLYLVDSAGARITDQIAMFPGRRGAGRIFITKSSCLGAFLKFVYSSVHLQPVVRISLLL